MKLMFTLCLVGTALLAGAGTAFAQDAAAEGAKVFAAQKCSICHSIAGQGNKRGPLEGIGSKLSADEIREWITNAPEMAAKAKAERKPAMKTYVLSKAELDSLVTYLHGQKK